MEELLNSKIVLCHFTLVIKNSVNLEFHRLLFILSKIYEWGENGMELTLKESLVSVQGEEIADIRFQ